VRGDAANDLIGFVADPNVHIQESKALTGNIAPGRISRTRRAAFRGPPKLPRGAREVPRDIPEVAPAHGKQPRQREWKKE
jgi:formate dehydrogenase major subunit